MNSTLKIIASRLALLNKRDLKWILERLPRDSAIELKSYINSFTVKAPEDLRALAQEIEINYKQKLEKALLNRSELAMICDGLEKLSVEDAHLLNDFLPDCVKRELKVKYSWKWLDTIIDGEISSTTSYVQAKILCLASDYLHKAF